MPILKTPLIPFSLVTATGVLQTSLVSPRALHENDDHDDDDDKDDDHESLDRVGDGLVPSAGGSPDEIRTAKPTNAPPAPSLGPTVLVPVATTTTNGLVTTFTDSTSTATLVVSITPITSWSSSATSSVSGVISPPSLSFTTSTQISSSKSITSSTATLSPYSSPFLPSVTNTMSQDSTQSYGGNDRTLVITLSTVLSVVGFAVIAISLYLCLRNRRRRAKLFNRGVTPIDDEEIESWKTNRHVNEKGGDRYTSRNSAISTRAHRKAPSNSVIQYQSQARSSFDVSPQSPRSFVHKHSFEVPQTPQTAVLARAPNARLGLTDETVPGQNSYVTVTSPKRQSSKLYKPPPSSAPGGHRTRASRGSRSSSVRSFSFGDSYFGENMTISPRTSNDYHSANRVPSRIYSTSTAPPRVSFGENMNDGFGSLNDHEPLTTVLSPPPLHRTEIGRAIG